jgi:flotillin
MGGMLLVILLATAFYATRYRKVGPNQALIISGRSRLVRDPQTGEQQIVGHRIVSGGGTFVWPVIERVDVLSLEAIPFDFVLPARFGDGQEAMVQGETQIAVETDKAAIARAATRLLNKTPAETTELARQLLTGAIRAYAAQTTVDEMRASPAFAAEQIARAWRARLAEVGLTCLTLDILEIG